jgi:hypothetical protein
VSTLQSTTIRSGDVAPGIDFGAGARVTATGGTVYYRDRPGPTASTNDGSITTGSTTTLFGVQYFFTTATRVDLQVYGLDRVDSAADALTGTRNASPLSSLTWTATQPDALGWSASYALTARITDIPSSRRSVATVSLTPEAAFDAVSTARSAPGATYYVDSLNGNNSNAGTSGAPFLSIWKGVQAANSAAVPTKLVILANASFNRGNNPSFGSVTPTVDIAFVASGGRVTTGTFDTPSNPSRDGTQTNTYSLTLANVGRVFDRANTDRFGNYTEFKNVGTAALCNSMPNSYALVAGTLYINRGDQQAVTFGSTGNTMFTRPSTACFQFRSVTKHVYIGGATAADGFDCEGGSLYGVLDGVLASAPASDLVMAVSNCTFKYGGSSTDTNGRSVSLDSWKGLAYFYNCRADAGYTDGFNAHDSQTAGGCHLLTVNCSAYDNGKYGAQSCNGWTTHETVLGIDIAGHYVANKGGSLRSIDTSKSWFAGTAVENDIGDLGLGGSGVIRPTAVRVDDTAKFWMERCRIDMPAGTVAYSTGASGSTIYRRNCWPVAHPDYGPGVFTTY